MSNTFPICCVLNQVFWRVRVRDASMISVNAHGSIQKFLDRYSARSRFWSPTDDKCAPSPHRFAFKLSDVVIWYKGVECFAFRLCKSQQNRPRPVDQEQSQTTGEPQVFQGIVVLCLLIILDDPLLMIL